MVAVGRGEWGDLVFGGVAGGQRVTGGGVEVGQRGDSCGGAVAESGSAVMSNVVSTGVIAGRCGGACWDGRAALAKKVSAAPVCRRV